MHDLYHGIRAADYCLQATLKLEDNVSPDSCVWGSLLVHHLDLLHATGTYLILMRQYKARYNDGFDSGIEQELAYRIVRNGIWPMFVRIGFPKDLTVQTISFIDQAFYITTLLFHIVPGSHSKWLYSLKTLANIRFTIQILSLP